MTTRHNIPETAGKFLRHGKPHHALAAVVALAIMHSIAAVAVAVAIVSI